MSAGSSASVAIDVAGGGMTRGARATARRRAGV
jgi:hypothetical protein